MRRIIAVLVALSMAFVIVGCGGGGEAAVDATEAEGAAAAAPAVVVAGPAEDVLSPVESGYPAPFPETINTEIPEAIQQKLDDGRPMVIFFYDGMQVVTTDQRTELDAALAEYRGLIDLVTFNLASPVDSPPGEDVKVATVLAADLGITATPYIMIVDRNGFVTWRYKGYIDREVIGREVLRATE
ncbi:MAG: hypothetical protein Q7J82_04115 [Coriobacteriia bacterium]|nr:hypothetical protein [Coriobacteriia bacterium]